jgi:hypothetical protein
MCSMLYVCLCVYTHIHTHTGEPLSCSERYSLSVPKDVPAKDFWAVNAYDADTNAFIKDAAVVGVTSQDGVEPPIEILLAPPDADASGEGACA